MVLLRMEGTAFLVRDGMGNRVRGAWSALMVKWMKGEFEEELSSRRAIFIHREGASVMLDQASGEPQSKASVRDVKGGQ
jgi:hypothetical protein